MMKLARRILFGLLCGCLMLTLAGSRPARAAVAETVRVAFVPDNPPYQFLADDGTFCGLHIDLLTVVAQTAKLELEFMPMRSEPECMAALDAGTCDIVLGVPERSANSYIQDYIQLENPFTQSTIAMLLPVEQAERLKAGETGILHSVVYENNTIPSLAQYYHISSASCYATQMNRIVFSSQLDAFDYLISGKADCLLSDRQSARYLLREMELDDAYVIHYGNIAQLPYTIVSRPGSEDLLRKINSGVLAVRESGQYDAVLKNWQVPDEDYEMSLKRLLQEYWVHMVAGITVLLAGFTIIALFNKSLKKQVILQTDKLQKANADLEQRIASSQYEGHLRTLMIERNPNGIVLVDQNGCVTQSNRAAQKLLGCDEGTDGLQLSAVPFGAKILEGKAEPLFRDGQRFVDQILAWGEPESQSTYQYSLIPLRQKGSISGALLTINDITAKLRENERMQEQENSRTLNLIVAGIAHEIRNPLMVIRSFAQLLRVRKDSEELVETFSDLVPNEVDRINRLVEDLVNFAKKTKSVKQELDVQQLVEYCIRLLGSAVQKPWLEITYSIEPGMKLVASADQMKQVLINILFNAIQAVEEKVAQTQDSTTVRHIRIRGWSDVRHLTVEIQDEGIGMNEATIQRVVDPFYTTKSTGTGLGMAVSKRFVEENQGTIRFFSVPEAYTTVTLTFLK